MGPSADRVRIAERYSMILARGSERGHDSAGVLSLDSKGTATRRVVIDPTNYDFVAGAISPGCSVLIGNNRAEPTTEYVPIKTLADAQPLGNGVVFVSHNGTISNDHELSMQYNINPQTRIDSAICPDLVSLLGVREALGQLKGSFALSIVDTRSPERLWLARNYKPLYIQNAPELGALFFASRPNHLDPEFSLSNRLYQPAIVTVPPYHLLEVDASTGQIQVEALSERTRNKRALVICSGGLDSTTAARWAQIQGYEVTLLHFTYHCRAQEKEMQAVKAIAAALNCEYRYEDLAWLGRLGGSSLTDTAIEITRNEVSAEYAYEWVPARNLIFCALAAGLCDRYGYDTLILGLNLEEAGAYPDNTVEFYELLDSVCDVGTISRPRIISPLGNLVKHEIVNLALEISAPIHLSWSCYHGGSKHCGHCGPCYMRRTAFRMLGLVDSVEYDA